MPPGIIQKSLELKKMKTLKITCKGYATIELDKIITIQGQLKELSDENFNKLKNQILKQGFAAPFFLWSDNGKMKCLDGTQRYRVLTVLREEGYTIPPLPYVEIEAANEKQAAEKLLSFVSQYGKTTNDGLYEFMHEFELDKDVFNNLEIPELNLEAFNEGYVEDEPKESQPPAEKITQCPTCGEQFNANDYKPV
jgi:hypothetical protein